MKFRALAGLFISITSSGALADVASSGFYISAKAGVSQFHSSNNTLNSSGVTAGVLSYDMAAAHLDNTSRTVFTPGLAIGYRFANDIQQPVRVELSIQNFGQSEQNFQSASSVNGYWVGQKDSKFPLQTSTQVQQTTRASTLMVNTYYDYPLGGNITPYVMAGVGAAFVKNSVSGNSNVGGQTLAWSDFNNRATNLAWALGVGVSWAVDEHLSFDSGYTFTDAGEITTPSLATNGISEGRQEMQTRVQLHTISVGMTYHF